MNARLRELLAAATDLPWEVDAYGDVIANGEDVARIATGDDHCMADAALIAEGITALPALLHQLAERDAEVAKWRERSEANERVRIEMMGRFNEAERALRAAERAREEAINMLREVEPVLRKAGFISVPNAIAAFLAASGGDHG